MPLTISPDVMLEKGLTHVGFAYNPIDVCRQTWLYRFRAFYGSDPTVYSRLFEDLKTTNLPQAHVPQEYLSLKYFLMTIYFLRCYPTEVQTGALFKRSEKTVRKWVWFYIAKIKALKDRKILWPEMWNTTFILTVDGTHCQIEEPKHPTASQNRVYYSHKTNSAALNYEIGLSIYESKLVWINGPYPAGTHDITIYRMENGLKNHIPQGKKVIGDEGYRGEQNTVSTFNPNNPKHVKKFKSRARARHESFNGRIKTFRILSGRFKHSIDKHKSTFEAVCVIVQYQFENGSPLFEV